MQRTRLAAFARAISSFVCLTAAVSLFSVRANSQSDCEAAAELTFVCQKLAASPSTDNLEDLLQRSIHVTDQCPSHGDAWYLRALIEQKLGKANTYAMQKAQRLNSPALKRGASPCETLAGNPSPLPAGNRDTTPPRIEITTPPLNRGQKVAQLNSCVATIEGRVTDSESRIREVTINGAPVKLDEQGKFKTELKLSAGENPVFVAAADMQGNSAREEFRLACQMPAGPPIIASTTTPTAPSTSAIRYFAVVIGNNGYPYLPKLKTAIHDAEEVEKILKEQYGFQTKLLKDATRSEILDILTEYRNSLQPEDRLLIYYAGHGEYDDEAKRAYWIPVDGKKTSQANWISADDITGSVRPIPARHILVISDSCYSGTLARDAATDLGRPRERQRYLDKERAGKSRMWMASGGKEPVADGGGSGHSIFARAVLGGLRGMSETEFTAGELFREYVKERVAGKGDQMPEYNPLLKSDHESGDFVFVRVK